jgi:glycosyltransferase involved in cell wall biosynthesis
MGRLDVAARTIWSRPAFGELRKLFQTHRPHIAHFHNTFPLISPAGYYAARAENVRVVQTLHNFRLCCLNALLFRAGEVCEACIGRAIPWPGVVHKCYRNSRAASAAIATMLVAHRVSGTWRNAVDVFIALSEFSRSKLIAGGVPADKIAVKSNFAYPDLAPGAGSGGYAIYVGRLSHEKGVDTLLATWRLFEHAPPLKIVGDGPLAAAVTAAAANSPALEWLRELPHEAVCKAIGEAAFLVLPSPCYEAVPCVVIEAFAKGTPVIVAGLGAKAEIVADGCTGLHFRPGDARDLACKVQSLLADPIRLQQMRRAARQTFEQNFTADANYKTLIEIYERALSNRSHHELRRLHVLPLGQS